MNDTILTYQDFILKNIEYIEYLRAEIKYWEEILKKRIFDDDWPKSIREIIKAFKQDITKNLEECQYYLKRIEEMRHDQVNSGQPGSDKGSLGKPEEQPGDTAQEPSEPEQEDLGFTSEEADCNRGADR